MKDHWPIMQQSLNIVVSSKADCKKRHEVQIAKDRNLVWLDMEMTGLIPETDEILEIAVVITDSDLNVLAQGPSLVLHQPASRFAQMDAWNREHHTKSGLWDKVLASSLSVAEAEQQVLTFIKEWVGEKTSPLCGNSVWQDRRFLYRYMPQLESYLHYRLIDVSTVKELCKRWRPDVALNVSKGNAHRALYDIIESIDELKFYRQECFKVANSIGSK